MGAYWLKEILLTKDRIVEVTCLNNKICDVVFIDNDENHESIRVYIPFNSEAGNDYLIDQDVVSRAIDQSATHIVYEQWIVGPTLAAKEYARYNNIKIYPVGDFIKEIARGLYH
jgi:hypothetical protein